MCSDIFSVLFPSTNQTQMPIISFTTTGGWGGKAGKKVSFIAGESSTASKLKHLKKGRKPKSGKRTKGNMSPVY